MTRKQNGRKRIAFNRRKFLKTATVSGVGLGGITAFSGNVAAATLTVDDDNPSSDDTDTDNSYATLQAAIDGASVGDTVEVKPGTYDAPIQIDKAITVVSTGGPEETTITNTSGGTDMPGGALVVLGSSSGPHVHSGLTFEGFTVDANADLTTDFFRLAAVRVWAAGTSSDPVTVENTHLTHSGHPDLAGIVTNGGPRGLRLANNKIVDNDENPNEGLSYGIFLNGGFNTEIVNNDIRNVEFSGISLGQGSNGDPHQSADPHDISIMDNVVHKAGLNTTFDDGLSLWDAGIHMSNKAHDITGTGNDIRQTEGYILKVHERDGTDLSNIVFNRNNFIQNDEPFDFTGFSHPTVDATDNWWGHPRGPDHKNADDVAGNVNYDPWSKKPNKP